MFRQSVRRFATTAARAAEGSTAYCTRVSTAQGVVNGLTEGMSSLEGTLAYKFKLTLILQRLATPHLSD